jgi:hypothetical protein
MPPNLRYIYLNIAIGSNAVKRGYRIAHFGDALSPTGPGRLDDDFEGLGQRGKAIRPAYMDKPAIIGNMGPEETKGGDTDS